MSELKSIGCLEVRSSLFEVVTLDNYILLLDHDEYQDLPDPDDIDWTTVPGVCLEQKIDEYFNCDAETEKALKEFLWP